MKKTKLCHRVGFGFDSHAYSTAGTLVLGGISFKGVPALKGHSDGDAVVHAVIDALLGAAGLGDIGDLFPDTSKKFRGIDSLKLLKVVHQKVSKKNFRIQHIDVVVVADRPRLAPVKMKMREKLSRLLSLSLSSINIKAKTPEGLCLFQKSGGVATWAIATLSGQ